MKEVELGEFIVIAYKLSIANIIKKNLNFKMNGNSAIPFMEELYNHKM